MAEDISDELFHFLVGALYLIDVSCLYLGGFGAIVSFRYIWVSMPALRIVDIRLVRDSEMRKDKYRVPAFCEFSKAPKLPVHEGRGFGHVTAGRAADHGTDSFQDREEDGCPEPDGFKFSTCICGLG